MRLGSSLGSQGLDMSKPLLNGTGPSVADATEDDAATMVAAIQDHIASCAKNLQENNFAGMEIKEERFPCDFDHMYASMAEHDSVAAAEVRQLKELLLLHLDLIQQQSEQLVNKDKQLSNLRQENDMLRQRLERMDRRVTLNSNKRHPSEPSVPGAPGLQSAPASPSGMSEIPCSEDDTSSLSLQPFPKVEGSLSPRGSPLTVGPKPNPPPERSSRSRKSSWSSDTAASRRSAGSDRTADTTTKTRTESPSAVKPPKRSRISNNRRETNDTDDSVSSRLSTQKLTASMVPVNTPVLYYVPEMPEDCLANKEAPTPMDEAEPSPQSLLEVPRWRIKPCSSCYSMEGTENLDDEVFLKRHQRLELDERRRKRWDIQRLREQRQYEKLRQRQQSQAQIGGRRGARGTIRRNVQLEPVQLWPDPEELQYIEVNNFLPVTAFGVPVPAFAPSFFSLPWVAPETASKDEAEPKKQRGGTKIKSESTAPTAPPAATPAPPPPPPPPPPQQPATSRRRAAATSRRRRGSWEKRRTSTRSRR